MYMLAVRDAGGSVPSPPNDSSSPIAPLATSTPRSHLSALSRAQGLMMGMALFAKKRHDHRTGRRSRTVSQETFVLVAVVVVLALSGVAAAAVASEDLRDNFRTCPFCEHINCVETPWWSCCITSFMGTCQLAGPDETLGINATIIATCNSTGTPAFSSSCSPIDNPSCTYTQNDPDSHTSICRMLCNRC